MPDVPLMITGGVEPTEASIGDWLYAGVQAVGLGSRLFRSDAQPDFDALSQHIAALLHFARSVQNITP